MMNRRFPSPYDDFFLNHHYYDEYQPSHHATSNDIYGRMYSDRNYGELSCEKLSCVSVYVREQAFVSEASRTMTNAFLKPWSF